MVDETLGTFQVQLVMATHLCFFTLNSENSYEEDINWRVFTWLDNFYII